MKRKSERTQLKNREKSMKTVVTVRKKIKCNIDQVGEIY